VARNFGYFVGKDKKIRVNTISRSSKSTSARQGAKRYRRFINYAEKIVPIGNAIGFECVDYTMNLFSDVTKKVTHQNLYHDQAFYNIMVS
jgi:enoyl-[acyl-carrier protein] reductase I